MSFTGINVFDILPNTYVYSIFTSKTYYNNLGELYNLNLESRQSLLDMHKYNKLIRFSIGSKADKIVAKAMEKLDVYKANKNNPKLNKRKIRDYYFKFIREAENLAAMIGTIYGRIVSDNWIGKDPTKFFNIDRGHELEIRYLLQKMSYVKG